MTLFDLLKAFLPLILLVGLLYVLLRYVKQKGFSINSKSAGPLKINVLNTKMIMPKKFISVVKVNDQLLVLGVSENSINLLKEFDAGSIQADEENQVAAGKNNFFELFKKNLGIR